MNLRSAQDCPVIMTELFPKSPSFLLTGMPLPRPTLTAAYAAKDPICSVVHSALRFHQGQRPKVTLFPTPFASDWSTGTYLH